MVNPFQEFRTYTTPRREIPLDQILARRNQVLQRLLQSHQALLEEESKQLVWVVEQGALLRAYATAMDMLQGIDFTVEDLEEVCLELDAVDGVMTPLGAPSGLFIAAMCNHVQADDIVLNVQAFTRRWPFLGYRLSRGRRLRLEGDAGDFIGALLEGGEVRVTGNAGNYAGIGMKAGLLHIRHSTGKYTGEGMRGGTLQVNGHIGSLGKVKQGVVYEGKRQVFPLASSGGHVSNGPEGNGT
jgi:hypothetical protein